MVRVRSKQHHDDEEEEQEKIRRKGKRKATVTVEVDGDDDDDEEEDEDGLDDFDIDGFIVDDVEDEGDGEEEEKPKQTQKKKKKRRLLKDVVLDDDDLELIRENKSINQENSKDGKFKRLKKAGVSELMEHSSDDGGSLFDDILEDESNEAEDDMADFIVDDEVVVPGKGDSLGQRKSKDKKHSSSLSKEAKCSFGKAGIGKVQIQSSVSDDPYKHELIVPINMYVAGEGNSVDDADIPERMQILEDIVGSAPVDRTSIEEESSWILSQLASNINPLFNEAESCRVVDTVKREDIVRFLELHHTKKYDIPFIAMYRKEQCLSLLEDPKQDESENVSLNDTENKPKLKWHKILWMIRELDKKWLLLHKRKSLLMRYYNKHFEEESQMSFLVEESSFRKQIFESITDMLKKAKTEREIDDIDMKFNLYFPPANQLDDGGYKRPQMKSYYSNCSKAGLWSLASKFGNPEKFGSVVTNKKVGMDNEEDPEESPEEIASIYKCETFQTSEAVLKGARHMAAVMLSNEISFRKYVRSVFMDKALVSTSPTSKGNIAIDSFHEFAGVKWLQDKPLSKFEDSQWFFIQKAEEEKLLQVKIKLPDHAINELTMTCNDAYLKDSEGTSTRLWNEQRKSVLHDAISSFLLPSMEKEARALLNAKAKIWLLMKYGMQLWNRVSVAPYQNNNDATAQERGVMACCWGIGKPGTAFVMLNSRGELVDVMHAQSLTLRSQNINDQQRKKNDQKRVLKFLTIHQPHVIVLGAANASCMRLREDINEIISMMSEDNFHDVSQEMKGLPTVVLGDEGLPRLYEDSEISMRQLPRQHGIVKRAVALGRYLLNPLAMVATLCGDKKEIVSWELNPLEKFLTSDEKLEIIEWVMIDVTNQVGIDTNLAIRYDWLLAPLQFISGLGPRKAGILHRELRGADVRNRRDFAKFGLNTKKVFYNAVGFLKVSCDDPTFVDTVGNVLDRTRIHPESYNLAEELARAVYTRENPDADASQVNGIEYIQNDPRLLECFDLNEYADRLEIEKGENRRETLVDIKMELLHGFKDPRRPFQELTQDEEFYMITGETGDVLVEGKRVQATVRHVQPHQAFCVLDSGMSGILFKDDFSDETEDMSLKDKLHEGAVLTCKIKLIDKNRCRVNLTCKVSDMRNDGELSSHDMDPYYCEGNIIVPSQQEATDKKELVNKHFTPRMISHPHFQNITADQAKEFLADKAVGEYIFHPSSRGLCYLTLSLKIFDGLHVHKDIVEGGKSSDLKSLLALGKTLKVGEEIFEDIDKVIEHYVNPLVVHLKAMINFRKFKKGSKVEVDELLKLEKDEYPNRIPYGFGISHEHPGIFILSYIRTTNPHHEFIAIHPKGFKFRKQIFENVEQLVAYFQNHINDNITRAKNHTTVGSGGWISSNVDQHKQSIGDNNHRGGRGDGFGRGRGRGRGRGGRGRGFGRSRDDSIDDAKEDGGFGSSKWGFGSSNVTDDSFAAGKSWGVGGSGEGNGGGNDSNQETSNGYGWGQGSGDRGGRGRGRGRGRGMRGGPGEGHGDRWGRENEQISFGGGWNSTGTDHTNDSGTGWAGANSSGWKDNTGKSWGEGSGGGATNFSKQNNHENERNEGGSNRDSSNEGNWGQGQGQAQAQAQGWGKGWRGGNQGDNDQGRGSQHGKWGSGGTDHTNDGGTGWASTNSSGWKDNNGKNWGEGGPGGSSGAGGATNFSKQKSHESEWNPGRDSSNEGNWGKGWRGGNQGDNGQGRGSEHGKWSSGGSDHTNDGGTGWKDNNGKSWGEGGPGGSSGGATNFSKQKSHESEWNAGRDSSNEGNWGKGWRGGNQGDNGQGLGSEHDMNRNSNSGKWGSGGSGGWANANSSGWKDNKDKSWGGGGPGEGSGGVTTNFSHQNSNENWRNAGGNYRDASNDSGWGQEEGGQGRGRGGRGRGRGWRGSEGDGQGRGRWGGNTHGEASNDNGWERGRGRGRGRRGDQGDGQGRGRWGGNSGNEESNLTESSWGNTGSGNENAGWSGKNATTSGGGGGGSGWGGTGGGKSW